VRLALEHGQAVVVRVDAAREDRVAVHEQVMAVSVAATFSEARSTKATGLLRRRVLDDDPLSFGSASRAGRASAR
jgi:hypothetical protein